MGHLRDVFLYQKKDFLDIFECMKGKTVTVRLLDPPLYEFLPKDEENIKKLAKKIGVEEKKLMN